MKKAPIEYPCTNCGKSADVGYSSGKEKTAWNGLVKKDERLCTHCFQVRGGINFFGKS